MNEALPDNNNHPAPPCARLEKAKNLLVFWAYSLWAYQNRVEINQGYVSSANLTDYNTSAVYKPFCFKMKTNAESTREPGASREPIGTVMYADTNVTRAAQISAMFESEFSARARMLLIALFLPPCAYQSAGLLSDAKIAQVFNFKPSRANQIKHQALRLVVESLLSPRLQAEI